MAEILTLTTPVVGATTSTYKLVSLNLDIQAPSVQLIALSDSGRYTTRVVLGQAAIDLMHLLNTANLAVKSLQRRALEYMAAQGDFTGTVNGTPD
jgi:hypothetical protein